mmetsp:Transcript_7000/g.13771  ORF Transcript_7000/g.13771 Transcript_7000/m.13771 type:complete len:88 (+) Transcript_7000:112-375(+)
MSTILFNAGRSEKNASPPAVWKTDLPGLQCSCSLHTTTICDRSFPVRDRRLHCLANILAYNTTTAANGTTSQVHVIPPYAPGCTKPT